MENDFTQPEEQPENQFSPSNDNAEGDDSTRPFDMDEVNNDDLLDELSDSLDEFKNSLNEETNESQPAAPFIGDLLPDDFEFDNDEETEELEELKDSTESAFSEFENKPFEDYLDQDEIELLEKQAQRLEEAITQDNKEEKPAFEFEFPPDFESSSLDDLIIDETIIGKEEEPDLSDYEETDGQEDEMAITSRVLDAKDDEDSDTFEKINAFRSELVEEEPEEEPEEEHEEDVEEKVSFFAKYKWVIIIVSAAVILTIISSIALGSYILNRPVPTQTPTATIDISINPIGIRFPGGWYILLDKSTIVNNVWQPESPEYLEGSYLRRVVAIPGNEQIDAVSTTLKKGQEIQLTMNNQDIHTFIVDRIEIIPKSEVDIYSENKPALIIIIFNSGSNDRTVITCYPQD